MNKEDKDENKNSFEIDFSGMIVKRKNNKRTKTCKNVLQLIYLKKMHKKFLKIENTNEKQKFLKKVAKEIGYEKRQLYKWIWDETEREKMRTKKEEIEIEEKNSVIFKDVFKQLDQIKNDNNSFLLESIFVPKIKNLDNENNIKIWQLKLNFLKDEDFFLKLSSK
jgi:hypothetical protein